MPGTYILFFSIVLYRFEQTNVTYKSHPIRGDMNLE